MRQRPATRLVIRVLPLLLSAVLLSCTAPAVQCEICGRHECANMAFTLSKADGTTVHACCARCGSHLLEPDTQIASMTVRDFETAGEIDAREAVYVEGSDVHPCRQPTGSPPRDEHGCCLLPAFDRCEPSVLAFRDERAARDFMARHGGTLTTWAALAPTD